MNVEGRHFRTIWLKDGIVRIIDQRKLPHKFLVEDIGSLEEMAIAIRDMHVRGAPLIGASAAFGMYLAALNGEDLDSSAERLKAARPTAINLKWAVDRQLREIGKAVDKVEAARLTAQKIADEDAEFCRRIGLHGIGLIERISEKKGTVNILTHCNAGWLACVDYGTATAPIYAAFDKGIKIHVWVDETRPRNQGASLTAWELGQHGVPHTVIPDNTGGLLMMKGMVDLAIVGTDRTTYSGDVANKIGTYLKALAAGDNNVPFYVALPSSTFDWSIREGKDIPIEERSQDEVRFIEGLGEDGSIRKVLLTPEKSPALNYGFDITPARLVTGLITERGICKADENSIKHLFPEKFGLAQK